MFKFILIDKEKDSVVLRLDLANLKKTNKIVNLEKVLREYLIDINTKDKNLN